MEITNDPHITRFVPPAITRNTHSGLTHRTGHEGTATSPAKSDKPPTVQNKSHAVSNPLAALFGHGQKPAPETRRIDRSIEDQPVLGRFVDILA